ncbi:D-alanyl-D-alanine carboxypeptidase/D-alanyl-D-alanine-endopeptidase [Streptomyces celluloflavus]|uniref:D-alanyl-D-alanine carboxypeptidase/D-alanyl-D-alanine-endopeptidase n=1 Tax=Streptomyces celluloflavus TaxID=58344 RepID=A0ABW7RPH5_9ACTN
MPETGSWQVRWQSAQRSARAAGDAALRRWRAAPRRTRQTWRLTAVSAATGLAVAGGAVAVSGPWDAGQRTAERAAAAGSGSGSGGERHGASTDPVRSAPPVLSALGGSAPGGPGRAGAPLPTGAGLAEVLAPLLKDPALGPLRTASVRDVAAGREVFGVRADEPATPASTVKLAVAVAALSALGPDHRIATTVVDGTGKSGKAGKAGQAGEARDGGDAGDTGKHRIILVGGGDPTLTARAPKPGPAADRPANLRTLAEDTARALKQRGMTTVTLGYDTSAYSGPDQHPIGPNENIAPVSALMADEARLDDSEFGTAPRDAAPAVAAARAFAGQLRERGITVDGDPAAAHAPRQAGEIATVRSLPLAALVERMLTHSDNDIAEGLARQTAIAAGKPASFAGAGTAVRDALAARHLPLTGAVFADGSGLDRDDRVSAGLLSRLLLDASSDRHPELRSVVTGLPVAGFTGTLSGRYPDKSSGAGTVRAKTGTLTGVNTLAGTVVDADGRQLVFAFMTSGTTDPQGAQKALDTLASAVAECGCR